MKMHIKRSMTVLVLLASMAPLYASRMDGIWSTRDNRIQVEIRDFDRGIRMKIGNQNWIDYRRTGNRFQSEYGSFCRLIDNQSIEWYDRRSRNRYTLYRTRTGSQYNHYNRSYYDGPYSDQGRGINLRYLEGRWYNESTGQHIQVKPRRDGLRVKFQGERWITFTPRRNGMFEDNQGNRWIINRNSMEFQSFNRDFNMVFSKGEYRGRRHDCYFGF